MLDMSCLMGSPSIPIFFWLPMNSGVVLAVVGFGIGNRLGHFCGQALIALHVASVCKDEDE